MLVFRVASRSAQDGNRTLPPSKGSSAASALCSRRRSTRITLIEGKTVTYPEKTKSDWGSSIVSSALRKRNVHLSDLAWNGGAG